ncbi:threonyl-tRNA synthetase [Clydaea vesicula]|uniref:threonine--tRNA ligase n=1 Tax=Clydaea vesicula TaxID=447962 RepID=A0AAD5XVW2_9FUNG|nr:threonyl-tRNA synthetase [Clydaea vesicula]
MSEKKQKKGKKEEAANTESYPLEVPNDYVQHRIDLFDKLKREQEENNTNEKLPIKVTLPDGKEFDAVSFETTPMDIAKGIAKSLAERTIIAKVDGILYDLLRPFENSCKLELLDFENDEAKKVFWHSSAHILGEACERHYGCHLCIGPPIDDGFYYEMGMERSVSQADYAALENLSKKIVTEKQKFERLVMKKEDLLEMFKHNRFKVQLITEKIPDGTSTTVYRCGPLIDLCYGPHVTDTGKIKAMMVTKNSSSYFLGDAKNESLQRVYGISFPDQKQLKAYKVFMEEAAKRDHRKIGQEQELFFFHEFSTGSAFFLPHGTRIYNTLIEMQRDEYRKRGFSEVISPNMYSVKLWEKSGHWANYQEDMFKLEVEKETYSLKPMNCPGHCLIFKHRERSYRELPIRMADFGVLHRNELAEEMTGCINFLEHIYGIFGFEFTLKLSTRPDNYLGELETWHKAEEMLSEALNKSGHPWTVDPGDGAFYGPKIDITLSDALKRKHQCATIQLDFQLPQRFELQYQSSNPSEPFERPVMIHRAILGSVERLIAVLTEHTGGKWPFWLSPRQIQIVPVAAPYFDYAKKLRDLMIENKLYADADLSDATLPKKIRNAEIQQYNFCVVVGEEEMNSNTVNVRDLRTAEGKGKGEVKDYKKVIEFFKKLKESKAREQQLDF